MNPGNFFAELKRRNVYKVAVAYAIVGWLVIQVAATIVPALHLPPSITTAVVVFTLLGFPLALIFAWAFELTPEGIKRTEDVAPNESVSRRTRRRLIAGIATAAVVAAALAAFQLISRSPRFTAAQQPTATQSISEKSIAVLPFENLSDEKANAYFASGIQDEILTRLAKIGALKVISRSSTKQYESKPGNLRDIAQQLGVAHILEGSVQKAGDRVHINVQLIRAATDEHLWAESYNRKLEDIFAVQAELAGAIADALNAKLTGAEEKALAARPTSNPAAYDAYLRGLDADDRTFGPEQLAAASRAFAEAVKLDPNFALAWARGSIVDGLIYFQSFDRSAERLAAVRHGADMAMQLAPDSLEAALAKGYYLYRTGDYDGAISAFHAVAKRWPHDPELLSACAFVERRRGNFDRSNELLQRALDRDPRSVRLLSELADTLMWTRRPAEARKWLERARAIQPDDPSIVGAIAQSYFIEGNLDAAGQLLGPLPPQINSAAVFSRQAEYYHLRRDWRSLIDAIGTMLTAPGFELNGWISWLYPELGWAQRWAGDETSAQRTFREGREKLQHLRTRVGDNGYIAAALASIEAGLGDCDAALREARDAISAAGPDHYGRASLMAEAASIEALCGRNDEALRTLSRIAREPVSYAGLGELRSAPEWDGLRGDPRFQRLLAEAEAAMNAQPKQ